MFNLTFLIVEASFCVLFLFSLDSFSFALNSTKTNLLKNFELRNNDSMMQ